MEFQTESLLCKACGAEIDNSQGYSFDNDLCFECSLAVEADLESEE